MSSNGLDSGPSRGRVRRVFAGIMILAGLALIAPGRWTAFLAWAGQAVIAPAGRYTLLAARAVGGRSTSQTAQPSDALITNAQADRVLTALSVRISQLERENRKLLALRSTLDRRFALAPAHIIGHDSAGLASVILDKGTGVTFEEAQRGGVAPGAPVIASIPEKVATLRHVGPEIVLGCGALIGRVAADPGPYVSRVDLITGMAEPFPCYVLRLDRVNERLEVIVRHVAVSGDGRRGLTATMVPTDQAVRVGDLVVLAKPEAFALPIHLAVGSVAEVTSRTDSPLHVDIDIAPFFSPSDLQRVYVLVRPATDHDAR